MRAAIVFVVAAVCLQLAGCEAFTSPMRVREFDPNKAQIVDYKASRRGQLIVPAASHFKSCSEPQPDVAYNSTGKGSASAKSSTGVDASGSLEGSELAQIINQNGQIVLFMREALFRLCELSLNENLGSDQAVSMYAQVLDTVHTLSESSASAAKAQQIQAKTLNSLVEASDVNALPVSSKNDATRLNEELDKIRARIELLKSQSSQPSGN